MRGARVESGGSGRAGAAQLSRRCAPRASDRCRPQRSPPLPQQRRAEADGPGKRRKTRAGPVTGAPPSSLFLPLHRTAASSHSSAHVHLPSSSPQYVVTEVDDAEARDDGGVDEGAIDEEKDGAADDSAMAPFVSSDYFRLLHFAFAHERAQAAVSDSAALDRARAESESAEDGAEAVPGVPVDGASVAAVGPTLRSRSARSRSGPLPALLPPPASPTPAAVLFPTSEPTSDEEQRSAGWLLAASWSPRRRVVVPTKRTSAALDAAPHSPSAIAASTSSPISPTAPLSRASSAASSSPSPSSSSSGVRSGLSSSSFVTGYYDRFFRRGRRLGGGSFGAVYLTSHVLEDVTLGQYACKIIPVGDSKEWLLRVSREIRALEAVRHPHVVSYRHSWLEHAQIADWGPTVPCLFLLMEYPPTANTHRVPCARRVRSYILSPSPSGGPCCPL